MSIFQRIFRDRLGSAHQPMPSIEEIIEQMQNRDLPDVPADHLHIFTAKDRTRRIIIRQSNSGYYTICYEQLCLRDEEEWRHLSHLPHILPAWWEPVDSPLNTKSFYGTYEEALKEMISFTDYRQYFP